MKNRDDVRGVTGCQRGRHAAAHENPERLLDIEWPKRRGLIAIEPLLLVEGEQAGDEIEFEVFPLGVGIQIEDLIVLPKAVLVKIAIRVVHEDVLGVEVGERGVSLHGLAKRRGILERKTLLAERGAEPHPGAVAAARCAAVSFVHEHKVVALEGIHGDGLVAHVVSQARDFENLHRLACEQTAAVLVEDLRVDSSGLKLTQVLLRQAFIWREQNDAVQVASAASLVQIVLVLEDVGVHDERFAGTRRHPVGKLVELRPGFGRCVERREAVGNLFAGVVFRDPDIDRGHEIGGPMEIPVEIDFREQKGEILKVFPDDRVFDAEKAGFVQPLGVANDVLVVVEQLRDGEPWA